ncbi:MAG: hypothetical protein WA414_07190 [Acidobacteriaceae bacterium]
MPSAARARKTDRDAVQSLEVLAHEVAQEPEQPTQFATLVRHFLERYFNTETSSADGDAKTRLVQVACALGIPPLLVTFYLYTPYHLPHFVRAYWAQAGDHYFYVVYAFAAMGILTIFEWDLLFPDLLDVLVLTSLPVRGGRLFRARVTAIVILLGAALFDANILSTVVLPAAVDPPNLFKFWLAHVIAVGMSGVFGAASFLALEGTLLALLGDRLFRKISLWLQGFSVMALLAALFAYPVVAGALHQLLHSQNAVWFPPFWSLGIYQRILDGPSTQPIFASLAHIGVLATVAVTAVAVAAYPLAWLRRTRGLVEGAVRRNRRNLTLAPLDGVLHTTLARTPASRAVWHFISQNLLRVPRCRMVLVMVGGAGAALIFATVVRLRLVPGHVSLVFSPEGLRATVPIVVFWTVSGLRSTFLAPADQRARWIFRVALGKAGLAQMQAAKRWVLAWTLALALAAAAWACPAQPAIHHNARFAVDQALVAVALSVLLTDAFFLSVKTIPFTGIKPNSATNFALLLIPYVGFFPAIVMFTVALEPVIEASFTNIGIAASIACAAHIILRQIHRSRIAEAMQLIDADDDEEEFPQRLGLRY